jgi:multidrug resistance efflux pump
MLEILLCSIFTILPDYLIRRYAQGKRIGREITLFSVWYELRWGIVGCLVLAVSMITAIFYFHPSTTYVTAVYRTVAIVPETAGRVAEVHVRGSQRVEAGQPLFTLEGGTQRATVEAARRAVAEVDAATAMARADLAAAEARILEAQVALQQADDDFRTRAELDRRSPGTVARREVERLELTMRQREAGVAAMVASRDAVQARLTEQLPAQRASAEAALAQAQVELDKTVIRAGVGGRVEQFVLQVGDLVNPFMRPAGVLVADPAPGRGRVLAAGFGQIEAQVLRPGMLAEVACASMPWTVIPMVVTQVQGFIASGQIGSTDRLADVAQFRPGTVTVIMEPLYEGGLDRVPPGSACIANAYTSNHEELARPGIGTGRALVLHAIDAVAMVHAILLRSQALLLPFRALVLSGH